MSKIKTFFRLLKSDRNNLKVALADNFSKTKISHLLTDKVYLKILYKLYFGKKLNLKNPETYNEKLQWLKLYDRKAEYIKMVDKFEAKKYVARIVGKEFIIPTYGIWERFDEIDFNKLPNQFVLKCTHDSGSVVICKDKQSFDFKKAKDKLEKCLKHNLFWMGREWPYKEVPKKIIAEKYMIDEKVKDLIDYKFYCFDGKVKVVMINSDRNTGKETKADYFDENYNWLDFVWGYIHADKKPEKPQLFESMVSIAEKLSVGIPQVRIDLYNCNGQIYFGEITFFDGSGFKKIYPDDWDYTIGNFIKLPKK